MSKKLKCAGKVVYFTEHKAILARLRYKKIFDKDSRVYNCDYCGWWHLTSRLLQHQLETFMKHG